MGIILTEKNEAHTMETGTIFKNEAFENFLNTGIITDDLMSEWTGKKSLSQIVKNASYVHHDIKSHWLYFPTKSEKSYHLISIIPEGFRYIKKISKDEFESLDKEHVVKIDPYNGLVILIRYILVIKRVMEYKLCVENIFAHDLVTSKKVKEEVCDF